MRVMRSSWGVIAVLFILPLEAGAQTPQATPLPPPNGDSIIQELRLLRQAVERHGRGSAQVQLLLGHLTLQDQRVGRAQAAADRLEDQAFALEQERRRIDAEIRDLTRAFEQAPDDARRKEVEGKLQSARTRQSEHTSLAGQVESRRTRARQAASEEQARYRDLDAKLAEFERELGRDLDPLR
jgi:predicted  nucleic acid-binding Zn-ribbon protein